MHHKLVKSLKKNNTFNLFHSFKDPRNPDDQISIPCVMEKIMEQYKTNRNKQKNISKSLCNIKPPSIQDIDIISQLFDRSRKLFNDKYILGQWVFEEDKASYENLIELLKCEDGFQSLLTFCSECNFNSKYLLFLQEIDRYIPVASTLNAEPIAQMVCN